MASFCPHPLQYLVGRDGDIISSLSTSLSCAEFLSDSPSTSASVSAEENAPPNNRRSVGSERRKRGILQPWPPAAQQQALLSRKRAFVEQKLNQAQHIAVRTPAVDRGIHGNPSALPNLLKAEEIAGANSHYFGSVQEEILPVHREQAIDWIFDVCKEERCDAEVFPLAVSLIDRFLSIQNIYKKDVQCVAGTCLFMASKMKAPHPINAARISYYTADSVSASEILSWELLILSQLKWEVCQPTALDFFDHMCAHYPRLTQLRNQFVEILHRIQRSHKLGLFLPSLQATLCLLSTSSGQPDVYIQQDARDCISNLFQIDVELLGQYLPYLERYCTGKSGESQPSPLAPPSSSELLSSPDLSQVFADDVPIQGVQATSVPATPLNDSGFCSSLGSSVASPDQTQRAQGSGLDSDCSPPKMRRYSTD